MKFLRYLFPNKKLKKEKYFPNKYYALYDKKTKKLEQFIQEGHYNVNNLLCFPINLEYDINDGCVGNNLDIDFDINFIANKDKIIDYIKEDPEKIEDLKNMDILSIVIDCIATVFTMNRGIIPRRLKLGCFGKRTVSELIEEKLKDKFKNHFLDFKLIYFRINNISLI